MLSTFVALITSFGKVGLIALGGGNSLLQLLQYETVTYRQWLGEEEFVHMLSASFLFPGLTALKLAAMIGYKVAGVTGLLLAVISLNAPGLILATAGYRWLATHQGPIVNKIMIAVQYGALALLAAATYTVAEGVVKTYYSLPLTLVCLFFFLLLAFGSLSPFWGLMGFIFLGFFLVN